MAATSAPASAAMSPRLRGLALQHGQLAHALQSYQQQLLLANSAPPGKADAPLHVIQHQQTAFDGSSSIINGRQLGAAGAGQYLPSTHTPLGQGAAEPAQQAAAALGSTAVTGALLSTSQHAAAADPKQQQLQFRDPLKAAAPVVNQQPAAPHEPPPPQQQQVSSPKARRSPAPSALPTPAGSSSPTPGAATPAAAAAAAGSEHDHVAPAAATEQRFQLSVPSPMPAPDPAEGPEAAAEHARYMQRFSEGATLAQRWHRLARRGVLGDIVEEWEEWQHDLALQELQAHNAAAARHARKHRRDEPEVDMDAPRQTRTRRVPTALQDYQVEAVATGTPEPQHHISSSSAPGAGAAVATGTRSTGGTGRSAAQHASAQRLHAVALEDADVKYGAEGAGGVAAAGGAQGGARYGRGSGNGRGGRPVGGDAAAAAAMSVPQAHMAFAKPSAANVVPGPQQQYGAQYQQVHQQPYAYGHPTYKQVQPQWQQQQRQLQGQQQQQQLLLQPPMGAYHTGAIVTSSTVAQDLSCHMMHMGAGPYSSSTAGGAAPAHPSMVSAGRPPVTTVVGGRGPAAVAAAPVAAMAAAPVSLPSAYAAAVGQLGPSVELNAAFEAFTRTLGRVDPALFMQSCGLVLQQQQQQRQ